MIRSRKNAIKNSNGLKKNVLRQCKYKSTSNLTQEKSKVPSFGHCAFLITNFGHWTFLVSSFGHFGQSYWK